MIAEFLENNWVNFGLDAVRTHIGIQTKGDDQKDDPEKTRHGIKRNLETERQQQNSSEKKTDSFEGVFRARQNGNPFEKPRFVIFSLRSEQFDGALGTHLGQIFGHSRQGLGSDHPNNGKCHAPSRVNQ